MWTNPSSIEWGRGVRISMERSLPLSIVHVIERLVDEDFVVHWCQSGLSEACLQSPHTLGEVDQKIRRYLELHLPGLEGKAVLAGNSVYADKMFLDKDLPLVSEYLHYRLVDVSSIKELARRWEPKLVELAKPASIPSKHRALDDIRDSISGVPKTST
ncbi:hypothetical protein PGTUg99_009396 [Puccinia graminis f. sp. tritici]|uniref:Exonuclease domain-containing protein n=1 Tax=Puccinia graminis f. sp. tritici TaxID=56615 RepID=A0A5B0Q151_PUCGR|nr:hypothetical protein PGTUg99_009396 [Puccinia graminis f. sp. tritici]